MTEGPAAPSKPHGEPSRLQRLFYRDRYSLTGYLLFPLIVILRWKSYVINHEMIYLMGPHRVAFPSFLGNDFTWVNLPPTSFVYDHLMAPFWFFLNEFEIANVGRFVTWALMSWAIAMLARELRLPWWSAVVGLYLFVAWGQSFAYCGWILEGFQVKALSYPLMFFSIAFAIRGQVVRAGMSAGLATAFHIIDGGWGCLALFLSMVANRKQFSLRKLGLFLLATAPFILPLVIAVVAFTWVQNPGTRAYMDEIYVKFAAPHCCDVDWFMDSVRKYMRMVLIFAAAPIVIFSWPHKREARIVGGFVAALIGFWGLAFVAQRLSLYSILKLFPGQLGAALPALFLFTFFFAHIGIGGASRRFRKGVWAAVILAVVVLVDERDAVMEAITAPVQFVKQLRRPDWGQPEANRRLYEWIRTSSPQDSIFITPFIDDFWPYAQRAQVASMRHPPFDVRLIEWKQRLVALNGFRRFKNRGWMIRSELEENNQRLTVDNLAKIHDLYGGTLYLTKARRTDLTNALVYSADGYYVYDVEAILAAKGIPTGSR